MANPDQEEDVLVDRRTILRELFRKHGSDLRLLLTLSELTGRTLHEVSGAWQASGMQIQSALSASKRV